MNKLNIYLTETNVRVFNGEELLSNTLRKNHNSRNEYFGAAVLKIKEHRNQTNLDIEYVEEPWWCKCNDEDLTDSYYVPDGHNEDCTKHHYRCNNCHSITQIG